MTSSTLTSMLLVLFLVLIVSPRMDKAFGEHMPVRKIKETNHPDPQTSAQKGGSIGRFIGRHFHRTPEIAHIPHHLHPPPPRAFRGKNM